MACGRHYLHYARWRRTGVGYGAGGGQHGHVEAEGYVLFAGLVDAFYVICLGFVGYEGWVFLDHEDEACLSLNEEKMKSK